MTRYELGDIALTLDELKKQMNVDFNFDDDYIVFLGKAAISQVFHMTHRSVEELIDMGGGDFPHELKNAALQLASHWYRVREAVSSTSQTPIPFGIAFLVKPYIRLTDD